ncbi:MAG: hypothetical protein ACXQTW_02865 [Candidatus Methanospirareceae archaeon]
MGLLKRIGAGGKKRVDISDQPAYPEEEDGVDTEEAGIFEDFDKEKEKVEEWWLQKGVEEAVEEELEEAEDVWAEGEGAESEDRDDLIYSLREEEEEEEVDMALKTMMDEVGEVSGEELLELGKTALREMEGEMSEES